MIPFTFRHTENIFIAKDNLGFYCFNNFFILDINLTDLTNSEIVDKIFRSDFFADRFIAPSGRIKKTPNNEHGPLLIDKLEFEDYSFNDLDSLTKKVAIYEMDENWGDDLPAFKAFFANSIDHISKKRLNESPIYYLNQEEIDDSKKIGLNYFTYFISLIIISLQNNEIILIDYGGD